jgi:hypothetical protein
VPVRLFDAHNNIVTVGEPILSFADRQAHSIALVVTMTDYPPIVIYDIPPVEAFIPVHMDRRV